MRVKAYPYKAEAGPGPGIGMPSIGGRLGFFGVLACPRTTKLRKLGIAAARHGIPDEPVA